MSQSEIIRDTEGDAWHARNRLASRDGDRVVSIVEPMLKPVPTSILEIGCGTGWRLERLRMKYRDNTQCAGVDLSWEAIKEGRAKYPQIGLRYGFASALGYAPESFDIVILGFFMYLVDRAEVFQVVSEVDRVLKDGGTLVVHDFAANSPHARAYEHDERLRAYKMNYEGLFMANPTYSLKRRSIFGTESDYPKSEHDMVSITVLGKNIEGAWPLKP